MDNIIKLANYYINNNQQAQRLDIVKTAGILSTLKNKIWSYFDKDKASEIDGLLDSTKEIKPALKNVYEQIKKVEDAIDSLDLDEYNKQLELLKIQLKDLANIVDNFKKVQNQANENKDINEQNDKQKVEREIAKANKKRKRAKDLPSIAEIFLTAKGKTLAELGVTAQDIEENSEGIKPLYASMALCLIIKNGEKDTGLLLHNQQLMNDEEMKKLFYSQIPNMTITRVSGRELDEHGNKKGGNCELEIDGEFMALPPPFQRYKLKPKFYLVDLRREDDEPFRFKIYRQLITSVKYNGDTFVINNKTNEAKQTIDLPGYNAPPKITANSNAGGNFNKQGLYSLVSKSLNKKSLLLLNLIQNSNKTQNTFTTKIAQANTQLYKVAEDNVLFETTKIANSLLQTEKNKDLGEFLLFAINQYKELLKK